MWFYVEKSSHPMDVNMQGQATPDVPRRRPRRLQDWLSRFGMFNLNDPRWGRGDDNNSAGNGEGGDRPDQRQPRGQGPNQGPPDLDELWRDFNRKLGGLLGGKGGGNRGGNGGGTIVAEGSPETVAKVSGSHTGKYLAQILKKPKTATTRKK